MKIEKAIIGVLLLMVCWLALNRAPKSGGIEIKYMDKEVEVIRDSIIKIEVLKDLSKHKVEALKKENKLFADSICALKDSLELAKYKKDTSGIIILQGNIIRKQDTLLAKKDSTIKWQGDVIDKSEDIITQLNKGSDVYKNTIVDLEKSIVKIKKRAKFAVIATAILGTAAVIAK